MALLRSIEPQTNALSLEQQCSDVRVRGGVVVSVERRDPFQHRYLSLGGGSRRLADVGAVGEQCIEHLVDTLLLLFERSDRTRQLQFTKLLVQSRGPGLKTIESRELLMERL